jgi:di/tricarboxylate transporter
VDSTAANRLAGEGGICDHIAGRRHLRQEQPLTLHTTSERLQQRWLWEMRGVAVLIHPESPIIGQSICSYQSIHWSSLVLIVGMLPLGDAL